MNSINTHYRWLIPVGVSVLLLMIPLVALSATATTPPPPDSQALIDTLRLSMDAALRARQTAPQLPDPQSPIALPDPVWRVSISQDGLYTLDYATLAAAGLPVTGTDPAHVHLLWRGEEVALREAGDSDDVFEPGEAWIFYGEKVHGTEQDERYTDENVYWLAVYDDGPGLRMTTRSVAPATTPTGICTGTALAEENLVYWARGSDNPGSPAVWFWEEINSPTTITRTYPITLSAPLVNGQALLEIDVASFNYSNSTNPDHKVALELNGTSLGEFTWDGKTGHHIAIPVSAGILYNGANELQVSYMTDVGHQDVYFDRATITYRRQPAAVLGSVVCEVAQDNAASYTFTGLPAEAQFYDVSDPLRPIALTGAVQTGSSATLRDETAVGTRYRAGAPLPATPVRYAPTNDLIAPATGADELIVAPRDFLDELAPLVAQRQNQGLRVRMVAIEDVYPIFNGGVVHPEAIRALVAHAYANWPGAPLQYLFLVGDGNFNFKGYNPANYGTFVPTLIPPYLEFADPTQGDVPVDARFGDVDGNGMPEVSVGRLPAQTEVEVSAYVAKLLAYEARPIAAWQLRAIMVADNGQSSDEGFDSMLDRLSTELPAATLTQTIYMEDYCSGYTACPAATYALTTAWDTGAMLLTYSGHGSIHRWAHEPLLINTQLTALSQTTALPFLLSLDCWDGYWMFPPTYPKLPGYDVRSIGEWATTVLTRTGAMAAFGPAGLAYSYEEELLARAMYQRLFDDGVLRVGMLARAGRAAISYSYMARTYTLLGDPAAVLALQDSVTFAPLAGWYDVVVVGSSVDLNARIDAQLSTRFGLTFTQPLWAADRGTLNDGVFTAPTVPGTVYLSAQLGAYFVPVTLTVVAGPPDALVVTPDPLTLLPGQSLSLTATVVDAWGNPTVSTATLTWESDCGTVDAGGLFTAPLTAGTGWVTATATFAGPAPFALSDSVFVRVINDSPAAATITPDALELPVGENETFTATLVDAGGDPVEVDATLNWQATIGTVDAYGVFTAPVRPGTGHVTATLSFNLGSELRELSAGAPVTVLAGPVVTLTLVPDPVETTVNAVVPMAAIPRDSYGNATSAGSTITWITTLGSISPGSVFTAPAQPGRGTITATLSVIQNSEVVLLSRSTRVSVRMCVYLPLMLRQ